MLNKKKNNKGFTLVELLVVIAIIGILAVVAVPALFKNINKAKVADLEADYNAIKSATLSYYTDKNTLPENVAGDLDMYMDNVPTKSGLGEGAYTITEADLDDNSETKEKSLFLLVGDIELMEEDKCTNKGNHTEEKSHGSDDRCYTSGKGVTLTKDQSKKLLSDMGQNMVYYKTGNGSNYTILSDDTEGKNITLAIKLIDNTSSVK